MRTHINAREALRTAFVRLRKAGWKARMNFWCCMGCGCSALANEGVKDGDNYVFYHNQDHERMLKSNECWLAWGGNGQQLVDALRATGLRVEWNGTTDERIHVIGGEVDLPDAGPDREVEEMGVL